MDLLRATAVQLALNEGDHRVDRFQVIGNDLVVLHLDLKHLLEKTYDGQDPDGVEDPLVQERRVVFQALIAPLQVDKVI